MRMRLLFMATSIVAVLGDGPAASADGPAARPDGCQCGPNSPFINKFPISAMRQETSRVLAASNACPLTGVDHARIAIAPINSPDGLLGYQLVVVDEHGKQLCSGTELLGIKFEVDRRRQPVVVWQILRTKVTPDSRQLGRPQSTAEYRLVYLISQSQKSARSLCTNPLDFLPALDRFNRSVLRLFRRENPVVDHPNTSSAREHPQPNINTLPEVQTDHLNEYAVIIPNGEYTPDGKFYIPSSKDLPPITDPPSLEWYEFACAGGALAHTDLGGVIKPGDSQRERTAALWMFLAWYSGKGNNTEPGVSISYMRMPKPSPALPQGGAQSAAPQSADHCPLVESTTSGANTGGNIVIEARWDERGAICMSHSRLWVKGTTIPKDLGFGPNNPEQEAKFRDQLGLPLCNNQKLDKSRTPIFISCARNHIDHPSTGASQ